MAATVCECLHSTKRAAAPWLALVVDVYVIEGDSAY